jgi:hypothetical protein
VDRDADRDNNKPEAAAAPAAGKDTQTSFKQLNIKA